MFQIFHKEEKHELISLKFSAMDLTSSCRKSASATSSGGSRINARDYLTGVARNGFDVILHEIHIRDI
jgi:hypothetical protein